MISTCVLALKKPEITAARSDIHPENAAHWGGHEAGRSAPDRRADATGWRPCPAAHQAGIRPFVVPAAKPRGAPNTPLASFSHPVLRNAPGLAEHLQNRIRQEVHAGVREVVPRFPVQKGVVGDPLFPDALAEIQRARDQPAQHLGFE